MMKLFQILAISAFSAFVNVSAFSSTCQQRNGWVESKVPSLSFCTRLSVASAPRQASSKSDDYEEFYLEEVDEEEEYEFDLNKKKEWMQALQHLARVASTDSSAVQKAQDIFDEMFEAYVMTEETTMWPETEVYNLLLEIHAYSRSPEGGIHAEKLLARMEDPTVEFIARPNLQTYLNVMDAWAMRKDPIKVEKVLERLEKRYEETEDDAVRPTADAYSKLMKAYGMVGDVEKVEEIFVSLLDKEQDDPLRANYKSWVQVMKAFSSRSDGTEKVQSLFREMIKTHRMGDENCKPKTDAYNTLIRALGQKRDGAEEAETVLFDLISRFRSGDDDVRPNGDTFRSVLTAQRRRKNVSGAKVEQLLQIQEGLYATTKQEDLRLDGRLYNVALYAIARARDPKKAVRARRIVDKIRELEDQNQQLTVRTYFNLLSACAYTSGSPDDNLAAFQIAVDALKELRETLNREPDSSCFGMFLKACANLMPESRKRDAVVEKVFRKCCNDGLVDDFVLSEFERASSQALQLEVLGGFLDDDVRIPKEWSKNVYKVEEI